GDTRPPRLALDPRTGRRPARAGAPAAGRLPPLGRRRARRPADTPRPAPALPRRRRGRRRGPARRPAAPSRDPEAHRLRVPLVPPRDGGRGHPADGLRPHPARRPARRLGAVPALAPAGRRARRDAGGHPSRRRAPRRRAGAAQPAADAAM
ncbi:MAG: hypothetical protein AVDCRST_MAG04-1087, partial [uncultured Acetobacteraceae bacterium]